MTKPTLILLPGLLNDPALWRHQSQTLADMADVTVADLTGVDTMAALAAGVLAQAPRRFALAGLSMGGYVAQEIMRQAPERVERLALIDTSARADLPEQRQRRQELIALARSGRFDDVSLQLLPNLLHPARVDDPELRDCVLGMARRVGVEAFARQQTAIMGRPDGRADLARIACATLVVVGRQDALTPPKVAEEMAANLARGKLVVIEDCGHLAPIERPQAVSAVLRYWLQEA